MHYLLGFQRKSIHQTYVGPRADQYMHVSSKMLNKEETAELNSVGRVVITIEKDCGYVQGGCNFIVLTPQAPCTSTLDGVNVATENIIDKYGLSEVWHGNDSALQSGNYGDLHSEHHTVTYYGLYPATEHHVTIQRNLFMFHTDYQTNKTYADYRPVSFELVCWLYFFDNSTHLEPAHRSKFKREVIFKTRLCKCMI